MVRGYCYTLLLIVFSCGFSHRLEGQEAGDTLVLRGVNSKQERSILNPFKGVVIAKAEGKQSRLNYIYFKEGKFYTPRSNALFSDTILGTFQSDTILMFGTEFENIKELRMKLAYMKPQKYKRRLGFSYVAILLSIIPLAMINDEKDSTSELLLKASPAMLSLGYHFDLIFRRRRIDLSEYDF